jgi:hypothetical protein
MKTKTVLTKSIVETTYNHNKWKQSQWQIKEELHTAQRKLGRAVSIPIHPDLGTTKDSNNLLPKQNFDVKAETGISCSLLRARL